MNEPDLDMDIPPPPISTLRQTSSSAYDYTSHNKHKRSPTVARSSFRTSINNLKTMTFIRGVMGQRNQDYAEDTPQSYPSAPSIRQTSSAHVYQAQEHIIHEETAQARCCSRYNPNDRKLLLWRLLNARMWKLALICFSFILLFGAQLRDLFVPKDGDIAVDVVLMVAVVFFGVDICMRADAEANYFLFHVCGAISYSSGIVVDAGVAHLPNLCGRRPFHVGSFLFWCDVISTVLLLTEISFLNITGQFDEPYIRIELDNFGWMEELSGSKTHVNYASPIEYTEWDLLLIIGKCMRAARFIRSSAAVKLAKRINWFRLLNMINPIWWWNKRKEEKEKGLPKEIVATSLEKRASWTNIILAGKLKAQENEKSLLEANNRGILRTCVKGLQYLGILKDDKEEFRRQMAATKIQRAWRRIHQVREGFDSHGEDDEAWKGRGASANNQMDKVLKKRSILHHSIPSVSKSGSAVLSNESERSQSETRKRRNESQVGSAMRELTGQRVAIGIILALVVTVLLTYKENSAARPTTMMILHKQTQTPAYVNRSLEAARSSSVPDLYQYTSSNGNVSCLEVDCYGDELRPRERLRIKVQDQSTTTTGYFSYQDEIKEEALVSILSTIFVLMVWFFGVTSFAGPVMILVVVPIERMVRLLGMLMLDPLGYTSTSRYKRFAAEEDEITKNTHWTKEVLKGMETSFLMSTILRIGSLMKVGFGSAGVEIIRNNLQKGQTKNELRLSDKGVTVSCIFLFSDIRNFTDATECLQEEVFVFTNKVAAVVHSICHAYGGSANKNIGDAFLLSWLLDEHEAIPNDSSSFLNGKPGMDFTAKHNQADKALLSVVKICMALQHDEEYLRELGEVARDALISKLAGRLGPIVQMGFGLHAGNAVQGAIGSTRKIDATYVSEAVERSEYLESSTKKYGLKMLMSDDFHRLLHPSNRRRCRKIDQIIIRNEDDDEDDDGLPDGDIVELLTFDMDIDALWTDAKQGTKQSDTGRESDSDVGSEKGSRRMKVGVSVRQVSNGLMGKAGRRVSVRGSDELSDGNFIVQAGTRDVQADHTEGGDGGPPGFVLPKGPALYNANVWVSEPMQKMRKRYIDGLFFQNFNAGLHSFYNKDWDHAKLCFQNILDRFEDGPSRYFLTQIENNHGKPPRNFQPYAIE